MKVGLAGFGSVAQTVGAALAKGAIPGAELTAISARDLDKAQAKAAALGISVPVVPLAELAAHCDLVVEAATGAALPEIATEILGRGRDLICISAGGILAIPDLEGLARRNGATVQIASGTMPGLDLLRAAAEGTIHSVRLRTRSKVATLANEPYVLSQGLDFRSNAPTEPVKVFEGSARVAATHFPRHLNIAVAVSLAGIGLDRTVIELWMDPHITGAVSVLQIESADTSLTLESRNVPSANPKTSRIVAPSVLAAIRGRLATIRVGS